MISGGKILAIDDEKNIRHLIKNEFSIEGFDVTTAESGEEGLKLFDENPYDVVLLDIKLPKMSGIEALKQLKEKYPASNIIMITGYGDIASAVQSIKLGAADYITKPFKLNDLIVLVKQVLHGITSEPAKEFCVFNDYKKLIQCPSQEMQKVYRLMERIAPWDKTVLIQGETGVGKDVLAYMIHKNSHRKNGPFITVDCGLISQNIAESELYGHKKGAFSGASESKQGLVEKSDKGTLFLDEVGNIDIELQKKFLRFLETRRFRRVGETREISVDTRVILATNLALEDAISKGTLRKDLFYRMETIVLAVPPLRDRLDDIIPLARHYLKMESRINPPPELTPEVIEIFQNYQWPGNVRELKSVISKALIMSDEKFITPDHLPPHIAVKPKSFSRKSKSLDDMEKEHIMDILNETGGNQTKASEILGINRKTLYKKLHKYKILC